MYSLKDGVEAQQGKQIVVGLAAQSLRGRCRLHTVWQCDSAIHDKSEEQQGGTRLVTDRVTGGTWERAEMPRCLQWAQ